MRTPSPLLARTLLAVTNSLARLRRRVLPPQYAALELGTMSWVSLAIAAFCELELPDALARGRVSVAQLCTRGYGDEAMLGRLLRSLSAYDVVSYAGGAYTLGRVGRALVGEDGCAALVRYANAGWHLEAYTRLAETVRTGRPGFEIAHARTLFNLLAGDDHAGMLFDAAMKSLTGIFAKPFAMAYDFSGMAHVVDVGGGTGALLEAVLCAHSHLRGTLFEIPHVARRAQSIARSPDIQTRFGVVSGDMFSDLAPAGDAYILSHVLHDWADAQCVRILSNVRRCMTAQARLLIYELVAPAAGNAWSQDRLSDIEMMAMLPGRERTQAEFDSLLQAAHLRRHRVIPTGAAESIVEAIL